MADEAQQAAPAQDGDAAPKKKSPKALILVLGLLIGEAGLVYGVVNFWASPDTVQGKGLEDDPSAELDHLAEVLIVNDRFPNHHTGRVWLWETEVQVSVKRKHQEYVTRMLEERNAEIKTGVARIIRSAHHNHLKEPTSETITRQLLEYLREVFGQDADGDDRIQQVLLPKCVGFPADF